MTAKLWMACFGLLAVGSLSPRVDSAPLNFEPTHTLEMRTSDDGNTFPAEARLVTHDSGAHLILRLADGSRIETDCVHSQSGDLKFQLARITDETIVSIHFVSDDRVYNSYSGRFTGMVDGVVRADMSGSFTLKPLRNVETEEAW